MRVITRNSLLKIHCKFIYNNIWVHTRPHFLPKQEGKASSSSSSAVVVVVVIVVVVVSLHGFTVNHMFVFGYMQVSQQSTVHTVVVDVEPDEVTVRKLEPEIDTRRQRQQDPTAVNMSRFLLHENGVATMTYAARLPEALSQWTVAVSLSPADWSPSGDCRLISTAQRLLQQLRTAIDLTLQPQPQAPGDFPTAPIAVNHPVSLPTCSESLPPPRRVCSTRHLSVCLSDCQQDNSKSC